LTLLFVGLVVMWVCESPAADRDASAKDSAKRQFELLKTLAGDWSGKASHGGHEPFEVSVKYQVVSGGSTVMETLFCGTDHEMITMYHLDGNRLILTHYCAAGNQPRMQLVPTDNPKKLAFKFLDGTNMRPETDMHMHEAKIEILSNDHVKAEWVPYKDGKPIDPATFDLKRKK
jgi:hypothetical protein